MKEITASVIEIIPRTPTVLSARFAVKEQADFFLPGQFVSLTLPGMTPDTKPLSRSLSISSSPTTTSFIEVSKRITSSEFSRLFSELRPEAQVRVRYPMGSFTYLGSPRKAAFLAGGIGITPFLSMLWYAKERALDCDLILLYANRTEREIAFRKEIEDICRANSGIKALFTLTRPEGVWPQLKGRIDAEMIQSRIPDWQERTFYLCGAPQMVDDLKTLLQSDLSLPPQQIKAEKFPGY